MENDPVDKSSHEEEYQFIDTEHSAEFAPPSNRTGSATASAKDTGASSGSRKTIFIFIGILVALFCLYKLYDVFSAAPGAKPAPVVAPKPSVPVSAPAPVATATPAPEPAAASENSVINDKIGTLEKVVSQVSQSNANLQDQFAGISTSLVDLQNNLSSLSQQVAELNKPKPAPVVEAPQKKAVVKHKISKNTEAKNKASYYVKAMIQGRAWLMTPEGATLTVSEQDDLPGYGKITSIDPEKGQISTDSGEIIAYRSDDR